MVYSELTKKEQEEILMIYAQKKNVYLGYKCEEEVGGLTKEQLVDYSIATAEFNGVCEILYALGLYGIVNGTYEEELLRESLKEGINYEH